MHTKTGSEPSAAVGTAEAPDLASQLESLLHTVWECEEDGRLNDRIDLALRRDQASARATQRSRRGL